jgi:glycosyltransferase involved in cell wall biosynthesis
MSDIHAIILTYNEERHIARCIESLAGQCASITIIDSGSTDDTVDAAKRLGAKVLVNVWVNYATQMNFAIQALQDRGGWLLRIDADEILDRESLVGPKDAVCAAGPETHGILVQRRIHFLGRRIKYGTIEPSWQLRLWRCGSGRCEQRWMDEHIKVRGGVVTSDIVLSDINLNSLSWWTEKHNNYASREAIDILNNRFGFLPKESLNDGGVSSQARLRRYFKEKIYAKAPGGVRALVYFLYRYVVRFGFLDGTSGFYFHLMQGLWYRTLVDAKVAEILTFAEHEGVAIPEAIKNRTGIDPTLSQVRYLKQCEATNVGIPSAVVLNKRESL